jgi:hypothetical protein
VSQNSKKGALTKCNNGWYCNNLFFLFISRDIVQGTDLKVYREMSSSERETLMTIRAGNVPVADAWKIIKE